MAIPASARYSTLAIVALFIALLAAAMVAGAGPAYRLHLLGLGGAFWLIRWGAWVGLGALVLAVIVGSREHRTVTRHGAALAVAAAVVGVLAFAIPLAMLQIAKRAPPIHDISTDTANPPAFAAVVPLRAGATNSTDYAGDATASQQHRAYPDIQPLTLPLAPQPAFGRALDVARNMGWHIVAQSPADGRIEATDTTGWFGFKDDIVVRVSPAPNGSRIDVRSESRLGDSDLGKNARRVRAYLRKLAG